MLKPRRNVLQGIFYGKAKGVWRSIDLWAFSLLFGLTHGKRADFSFGGKPALLQATERRSFASVDSLSVLYSPNRPCMRFLSDFRPCRIRYGISFCLSRLLPITLMKFSLRVFNDNVPLWFTSCVRTIRTVPNINSALLWVYKCRLKILIYT